MTAKIPTVLRLMLKVEQKRGERFADIDGFIFHDFAHAQEWTSQSFVDDTYSIALVRVRKLEDGQVQRGDPKPTGRTVRVYTIKRFLQLKRMPRV